MTDYSMPTTLDLTKLSNPVTAVQEVSAVVGKMVIHVERRRTLMEGKGLNVTQISNQLRSRGLDLSSHEVNSWLDCYGYQTTFKDETKIRGLVIKTRYFRRPTELTENNSWGMQEADNGGLASMVWHPTIVDVILDAYTV